MGELLERSITCWAKLTATFLDRFFPPSRIFQLKDEITNFRQIMDEPLQTWLRFQKIPIQRPTHDLTDVASFAIFWALDKMSKSLDDNLVGGTIMNQPFGVASTFLDRMVKTNRA